MRAGPPGSRTCTSLPWLCHMSPLTSGPAAIRSTRWVGSRLSSSAIRPDAVDPATGERYPDVIVFWVASEEDKQALVQDAASPFFTTAHFDGHLSVLLRGCRISELTREELAEIVEDAWLSRASARRAAAWLNDHPPA